MYAVAFAISSQNISVFSSSFTSLCCVKTDHRIVDNLWEHSHCWQALQHAHFIIKPDLCLLRVRKRGESYVL